MLTELVGSSSGEAGPQKSSRRMASRPQTPDERLAVEFESDTENTQSLSGVMGEETAFESISAGKCDIK
jgi:hypothetical protein